ncbi:MAG: hypothetical protein LQ340_005841 [Diploschistes diacapsis]|nr:MAG: hypothetical protein LQ340_005841 [Diploschistes diacapsis]
MAQASAFSDPYSDPGYCDHRQSDGDRASGDSTGPTAIWWSYYLHQDKNSACPSAIYGIDGHAYGSWTTKAPSEMWLRDFLSEDFPRFRTTVYGYNSKLSGHAGGSLEQYAQRFLEDLKDVRATDEIQKRPIFFIAYSFGGILVMRAFVKANQVHDYGDRAIISLYKATYGIMFFAVPHGEIDFENLTHELEKDRHPLASLFKEIGTNSSLLRTLSSEFKDLIRSRK